MRHALVLVMLSTGLLACAGPAPQDPGHRVNTPPAAERETDTVVRSLLVQASRAERAGDLGTTEAALERALRIEPRDPQLWHYLGRLRLVQGRHAEAVASAAKSNSLARGERALQRDNWDLTARALRAAGDLPGAAQAEARAAALAD